MENTRISPSNGHAQAQQTARSARPGSETSAAGATAAPGSFLALLAALDGAATGGVGEAVEQPGAAQVITDAPTGLAALAPVDEDPMGLDAATMAALQGLMAPADATVPQPVSAGNSLADEGASVSRWSGALVGGNGQQQGLVAETAQLDGAADVKGLGPSAPAAGYGRILSRMQAALAPRAAGAVAGLTDPSTMRSASPASSHLGALSAPALSPANMAGVVVDGSSSAAVQAASAHPDRALGTAPGTMLPGDLAAAPTSGVATAQGSRPQSGGAFADNGAGAGGSAAGMELTRTPEVEGVDAAAMFADPSQAAAEESVAEQVTYWVNQKTQNAELTLQEGGQPVEVSVSLQGHEAHVSFRSDQAETRAMLDRSMAQLSDLLRSEGLVLSGMSVGTSARDASGAGDSGQQRPRDGGRQARVAAAATDGGTAPARRAGAVRDGAVDIFV
ncbi:flagellar hook-length control protein FliK [Paracidovorax sp. MALMAid1276]|uniref:flagellar hook-length control protein FliK n=1 Tax=Paracidovorax sp. MALMAid1276 TaxID=3411631 RepID=UPI003B9CDAFD